MKQKITDKYIAHLSIDCVVFGYRDGALKVLLSKLKYGKDLWALPGGYILKTESVDHAAARALQEHTSIKDIYLEQFRVFGKEDRVVKSDHRKLISRELKKFDSERFDDETIAWMTNRFVSVGYYALVDIDKVSPKPGLLADRIEWRDMADLPAMTHDHNEIAGFALEALRLNIDQKLIGFRLLPETFTMKDVQELYEAVFDKAFARNNFQKRILDLQVLERLEKKYTGAANKAPYLYRFKR